jgi:hypothetical protein
MTGLLGVCLLALATATMVAVDLDGRPVTLADPGSRAVVLFFAASDCPISNRYVPEMQRLARQVEPLGVRVWFVYSNPQIPPKWFGPTIWSFSSPRAPH